MHVYIPASPSVTKSMVYVVDVFSVLTSVDVFSVRLQIRRSNLAGERLFRGRLDLVPFRIMVLFGLGTPLDIHVMVTFLPLLATGSGVTVKDVMLGLSAKKQNLFVTIMKLLLLLFCQSWS